MIRNRNILSACTQLLNIVTEYWQLNAAHLPEKTPSFFKIKPMIFSMVHNNFVSSMYALQLLLFNQSFKTYLMEEKTELKCFIFLNNI